MREMTSEKALATALFHHQNGRLAEAERIYRQVLAAEPNNAVALHRLGVLAAQTGHMDAGIELVRRAIAVAPSAMAWSNLGKFLVDRGEVDESVACCRNAIAMQPNFAEAYNNLGVAMRAKGALEEAIGAFRMAARQKPDYALAYSNLSAALTAGRSFNEAIDAASEAIRIDPSLAEAHANLGSVLRENGQLDEAETVYRGAIEIKPDFADAHHSLGIVLYRGRRFLEAIAAHQEAIRFKPDFAEAYNSMGITLREIGRLDDAVAACARAIQIKPTYALAHNNLGMMLQDMGRFDEAEQVLMEALRLKPELAVAHNNLGNVYKETARIDDAIRCYARSMAIPPSHLIAQSNRLYTLYYHPAYDSAAILREHQLWNQQTAKPLGKFIQPHDNDPNPDRRLRIGYVSPNFWSHCQALFTGPLFSCHDHQRLEIFCYADAAKSDDFTQRLRGYADAWRDITLLNDEQTAQMIRQDRIDILVDLTLHMSQNRLPLFARKPAPVQATWLGYPGTTGLETMDYRLTDPYLDPPGGTDGFYSEKSIRLPNTFWCYDPRMLESEVLAEVNGLPALAGGHITFGCLNNFCKVNQGLLELWKRVLQAVPGSRLLLLAPAGSRRQWVMDTLGDRVDFVDRQARRQYLETYHRIDMGLDTLPYNGHTTSLDSLWMGVPVVTLVGKTVAGRAGWSQLSNLGLTELAAQTDEQFVSIATELAGDLPRLGELRRSLRHRMTTSPLMDAGRFAGDIESAYRQMWREWSQKKGSIGNDVHE